MFHTQLKIEERNKYSGILTYKTNLPIDCTSAFKKSEHVDWLFGYSN